MIENAVTTMQSTFAPVLAYLKTPWIQFRLPWFNTFLEVTPLLCQELVLTCISFHVVFQTTNRNRKSWIWNIIKKTLGLVIYVMRGLFIKCTLDILLIINSLYAWYKWGEKTKEQSNQTPAITTLSTFEFLLLYGLGILFSLLLGLLYSHFGASYGITKPYLDGLHAVMSITNYYLLGKKKREAWLFSLTGQIIYIYVCYQKGMVFLFKYVFYAILSIRGFYRWHKLTQEDKS